MNSLSGRVSAGPKPRARPLAVLALAIVLVSCGGDSAPERAEAAYEAGNYREALVIIRAHLKKGGGRDAATLFLAGRVWLRAGSEAEAQASFDECRIVDPSYAGKIADFLRDEAAAAIEGNDAARGKRLIALAVAYRPGTSFGKNDLVAADVFLDRRDYAGAIPYLERYVRANPDEPGAAEAYIELASAYEKSGSTNKAVDTYREFQERYPKSKLASNAVWEIENLLLREAEERVAQGEPASAETLLVDLAATAASPIVKERSNFLMGEICEARGDTRGAVRWYRAVVEGGASGRLVDKAKERIEKLEMSNRRR